jgi:hypothetical protein
MKFRECATAAASLLLICFTPAASKASDICATVADNLVGNCGFETGDLTDWNVGSGPDFTWQVSTPPGDGGVTSYSGDYFVQTACVGAECVQPDSSGSGADSGAWLYQDLVTTAGDFYDVTFYFAAGSGDGPNELQVLWGASATPLTATAAGTGSCDPTTNCVYDSLAAPDSTSYVEVTVDGLLATSDLTRLEFLGRQDPTWNGLDSISAAEETSTPEPASLVLAGIFFLVLGLQTQAARLRRYRGMLYIKRI